MGKLRQADREVIRFKIVIMTVNNNKILQTGKQRNRMRLRMAELSCVKWNT